MDECPVKNLSEQMRGIALTCAWHKLPFDAINRMGEVSEVFRDALDACSKAGWVRKTALGEASLTTGGLYALGEYYLDGVYGLTIGQVQEQLADRVMAITEHDLAATYRARVGRSNQPLPGAEVQCSECARWVTPTRQDRAAPCMTQQ